jgi:chemotaxis-related protein WspD
VAELKQQSAGADTVRAELNDCWNKIGVRGDGSCGALEKYVHCRNCPVYGTAAAVLLDGNLPPGYRVECTEYFSQQKHLAQSDTHAVLVFRIGNEWLALPSSVCSEVIDMRPIHVLPHRQNDVVRGLASVRGELLVCVSIGNLLGVERQQVNKERLRDVYSRLIVIHGEGGRLVFPANEVHGILRFHTGDLREVPATVSRSTATYSTAVLSWEGKTIGCLDDQLLLYALNRSMA